MKKATVPVSRRAAKPATQVAKVAMGSAMATKAAGKSKVDVDQSALLLDSRALVQSARQRLATVANATYTLLCWQIGRRLLRDNLQSGRAAYGKQILATVSQELTTEFGAGFNYTALTRMARFAEWMTDDEILATLSQTLSWSHLVELLPIKDPLARDFYAEMCRIERWDVRTLRQKIGGMLFQRTALSKRPTSVISAEISKLRDGQMSPDTFFRDPYLLDLLGLKGAYSERDLESAILREIEGVLLELGTGFAFVARQKRMSVGKDDFHLDLLFFHRHLRRLIAVELKLESFQQPRCPAHRAHAGWSAGLLWVRARGADVPATVPALLAVSSRRPHDPMDEDWQPGCQTRRDYAFRAAEIAFSTARCRSSFKWAASI